MAEYHFVSIWQIQAPIERVWEEIYHAERWPSWWKYVVGVDELEPGAADGVGKHLRLLFRTRLPYTLGSVVFRAGRLTVEIRRRWANGSPGRVPGSRGRWHRSQLDQQPQCRRRAEVHTDQQGIQCPPH
jgi:hypothetical protein